MFSNYFKTAWRHLMQSKGYSALNIFGLAIGMAAACMISEELTDFKDTDRVIATLKKYGLPTQAEFDGREVLNVLRMDKKKEKDAMNYVLLNKIGQGVVKSIPIVQLEKLLQSIISAR